MVESAHFIENEVHALIQFLRNDRRAAVLQVTGNVSIGCVSKNSNYTESDIIESL